MRMLATTTAGRTRPKMIIAVFLVMVAYQGDDMSPID
jgi:hypothetical protein